MAKKWKLKARPKVGSGRIKSVRNEFKEFAFCLSGYLDSGYALERALLQVEREHEKMFGKESLILADIHEMNQKIAMNVGMETAFEDFAKKLDLEEAINLSDILSFAKRSGGNYGRFIKDAARKINEKILVQQEIDTLTAEKRLEFRIMSCMPMGILAYVALTSKEFVAPLFESVAGRIVLVACALLYAVFFMIGKRIIDIDV